MTRRIPMPALLLILLPLATLPLAGCGIPGGIAYAIKSSGNNHSSSGQAAQPASEPAPTERAEEPPPPPPEPAPRDSIKVEQLPSP